MSSVTETSSSAAAGFQPYTNEVYGWAFRVLGRHHDALDVVQDVFLRWAQQCRDRPPHRPRGWLRKVTLNRAIDLQRHRATSAAPVGLVDGAVDTTRQEPGAGVAIDQAALRDDIASALDGLTDAQRGVLVAKVYDDLTFAQIADEMSLAVSTVKTHYLRAVRGLRDRLQPRWAEEE
jgi:RNA polymerase sigma-70 factor (ECF subfamily)